MAQITGTPHVSVGMTGGTCTTRETVAPVCTACRQVDRWMQRTVSWTNASFSRFKSIIGAILHSHDEVLQSLCGFCAGQENPDLNCSCVQFAYVSMGLPLAVRKTVLVPDAVRLLELSPVTADCLPTTPEDPWVEVCTPFCFPCEEITLDPCNDIDHLSVVQRILSAARYNLTRGGRGEDIRGALALLFPASTPVIVAAQFGVVYVSIQRALTDLEREFFDVLRAYIPRGFGVEIKFISLLSEACP